MGYDVAGKTVVITGASAGIGAAAARQLHLLGAEVVVVGRDPAKTAAVAAQVDSEPLTADFTSLDAVRRLADDLRAGLGRLDVLALNAGGLWPKRVVTGDGHEQTFQVNHLAGYLLAHLLREPLAADGGGRIVVTSSVAHTAGRLDPRDYDSSGRYRSFRAYGTSKLANVLFAREASRRWGGDGISATSFHPGAVASEFGRDSAMVRLLYGTPLRSALRSVDDGADTLTWLAASDPADGWEPGGYYADRKRARTTAQARDDALAARLWEDSARMVGVPA